MNVFVLGGGASGMVAAIVSKRLGNNVTIIEKNNNLGKKLLLTGNGRCNYFNEDMNISNFYSDGDITKIINQNNLNKVKDFFDSIGIIPNIKEGYYYPYANTSYAILNVLLKEIEVLGINIINEEVVDIKDNIIITNNNSYKYDKVIISLGGASYTKTGSNGFGYGLLKRLGHTIIPVKEALVPLVIDDNIDWKGIRLKGSVSLYIDDKYIMFDDGEIQLNTNGISGICVMNISRFIDLNKTNIIHINFTKDINNLYEFIDERNKKLKNRTVIELLEMIINYKLLYLLFKKVHINADSKWDTLSTNDKKKIIEALTDYKVKVIGTRGFEFAETVRGGVPLDEIDEYCVSKIVPNLCITGELIDIDARCGGYNLTNAWITGILAGEKHD